MCLVREKEREKDSDPTNNESDVKWSFLHSKRMKERKDPHFVLGTVPFLLSIYVF